MGVPVRLLALAAGPALLGCGEGRVTGPAEGAEGSHPRVLTAVSLAFLEQPVPGLAGLPLVDVVVAARDSAGEIVAAFDGPVTISLSGNAGTFAGKATVNAGGGIARFSGVRVSDPGAAYALTATSPGLTAATSDSFDVAVPGDRIAFVNERDGPEAIYVANADGTGIAQLTAADGADYGQPSWSPDGSQLLFAKDRAVWVMNADGSQPSVVVPDGFAPVWTVDGRRLRFATMRSSPTSTEFDEVSADGTGLVTLAKWQVTFGGNIVLSPQGTDLQWSPDRSSLAFTWIHGFPAGDGNFQLDSRVVVTPVGDLNTRYITSNPDSSLDAYEAYPAWSPDGKRIALYDGWTLETIASDGSAMGASAVDLSVGDSLHESFGAITWSPDGKHLAVAGEHQVGLTPPGPSNGPPSIVGSIWVFDLGGAAPPRRIISGPGWYGGLAWAPRH